MRHLTYRWFTGHILGFVLLTFLGACSNLSHNAAPDADNTLMVTGFSSNYEAESLNFTHSGDVAVTWDDTQASGGQWHHYKANADGDFIEYSLPVSKAGSYAVRVRVKKYTNRGKVQLAIGGSAQGQVMDLYAANGTYATVQLGLVTFGSSGPKSFRFTVLGKNTASTDRHVAVDAITLVPVYEAENLPSTNSGDPAVVWSDVGASGGQWHNYQANAVGDYIEYTLDDIERGTYQVKVVTKTFTNRGKVQLSVAGGGNVGAVIDLYSSVAAFVTGDLGSFTFNTTGSKKFRFTVSGKNSNSTGHQVGIDAILLDPLSQPTPSYKIRLDQPRQTIWGLGVEIQSDTIGSGNDGLPDKVSGVPHDLIPSEKTRFYNDLLKGFRYVRLALGLYVRGLTPDKKNIIERYPGQMQELSTMIQQSGMEGAAVEYWSPAPYWKSNGSYLGGSLKQFDNGFLNNFADAVVQDLQYLKSSGIPVTMWGLQNEPDVNHTRYSTAGYTDTQYYSTFKVVAPKVKAAFPNVFIHNESRAGQDGRGSELIRNDNAALSYVDGWSWHRIGTNANEQISRDFRGNSVGRPVFNNEFEYFNHTLFPQPEDRLLNTAQSITNWMTFQNSPTWFWLHALKPTYNSESERFGLGLWRPYDDNDFSKYSQIQKGHFDFLPQNWHAVAGFLKYMPWDSVRYHVDEPTIRNDSRIMAWRTPAGKHAFVLTNRSGASFTFDVDVGVSKTFSGHRYTLSSADQPLGTVTGPQSSITVPNYAIEFWVEN